MKKFSVISFILFLILFTAIVKNSTKRIDDQIFSKGNYVRISFDGKSGEQPVSGRIHSLERNRISLIHTNDRVGTVCIHFPKVGYLIEHL